MASKLIESFQTDLPTRVYRVANGFNEALYLAANEPSLGMYRIQEHIQLTVPRVVDEKQMLAQMCGRVQGVCYDLEYNIQAVQSMSHVSQFPNISRLLIRCLQLKTKLSTASDVTNQHKPHTEKGNRHDHSSSSVVTSSSLISCALQPTLQLPAAAAALANSAASSRHNTVPPTSPTNVTQHQLTPKCFD